MHSSIAARPRYSLIRVSTLLIVALATWLFINALSGNSSILPDVRGIHSSGSVRGGPAAPVPVLPHREDIFCAICARSSVRNIAEIGVLRGHNAESLLLCCPNASYVGVDLWAEQRNYDDGANASNSVHEAILAEAKAHIAPYGGRGVLLRNDSISAAAQFPNGYFDLVYLDARHDYRSVLDDIHAWASKVRSGGFLSGHDFLDAYEIGGDYWVTYKDGSVSDKRKAVRSAVTEFSIETNRQVFTTYGDIWCEPATHVCKPFPSWFMRM